MGEHAFARVNSVTLGSTFDDAQLVHLKQLRTLERLDLRRRNITDAGLVHVSYLNNLRELDVSCTKLTDAGLAHLTHLYRLKRLNLAGNNVSGSGLSHLKQLNLETLELYHTPLVDQALEHLSGLKRLETLNLQRTKVTNRGLQYLTALPHLKRLYLDGTNVTEHGVNSICDALPNTAVHWAGMIVRHDDAYKRLSADEASHDYEFATSNDSGNLNSIKTIYNTSRYWMEAEVRDSITVQQTAAARQRHLTRMTWLLAATKALHQANAPGGGEERLSAAEQFVAEARQWCSN